KSASRVSPRVRKLTNSGSSWAAEISSCALAELNTAPVKLTTAVRASAMAENDSTSPAARNSFLTVPTFFDLQREVVYQNVWPSENWKNSRSSSELALRARPKLTEIGPKPVSQ